MLFLPSRVSPGERNCVCQNRAVCKSACMECHLNRLVSKRPRNHILTDKPLLRPKGIIIAGPTFHACTTVARKAWHELSPTGTIQQENGFFFGTVHMGQTIHDIAEPGDDGDISRLDVISPYSAHHPLGIHSNRTSNTHKKQAR